MTTEKTKIVQDDVEVEVEQEIVEDPPVVGDVIVVDPYASQANIPDENRIWPPPSVYEK
jgi:hypothetical protein